MKPNAFAFALAVLLPLVCAASAPAREPGRTARVKVQLGGAGESVEVRRDAGGEYSFVLQTPEGPVSLSPDRFAARVHGEQTRRHWAMVLFNITTWGGVVWVALGLLGQLLFTGRMLVQWLASERSRRSVVPPVFWWLSLGGATMLMVYFVWRRDLVGFLGQSLGWFIYLRNLWMIHRSGAGEPPSVTQDPAPEPELGGGVREAGGS